MTTKYIDLHSGPEKNEVYCFTDPASVQLVAAELVLAPLPRTEHVYVCITMNGGSVVDINTGINTLDYAFAGKLAWNAQESLYRLQFVPAAVTVADHTTAETKRSFSVVFKDRNGKKIDGPWSATICMRA